MGPTHRLPWPTCRRKNERASMSSPIPAELMPPESAETPCFVIAHERVRHNLARTAAACGGVERLVSHVKTSRAPWLIRDLVSQGVTAFKAATSAEVELVAASGAREVILAHPQVNATAIDRVIAVARRSPDLRVAAIVDSPAGVALWRERLNGGTPPNLGLRVDLDPGMGRTGMKMDGAAAALARDLMDAGLFCGWHVYDGHVHDAERTVRQQRVDLIRDRVFAFLAGVHGTGAPVDVVAGGSYTFDLWPRRDGVRVSPGSWIYSSARHGADLPEFQWQQAAFVVASVVSAKDGTVTLNAGYKAISPDQPLEKRFQGPGAILSMSEEHTVLKAEGLPVGRRVALIPEHACTTAYLYPRAWVLGLDGRWSQQDQLGSRRFPA